MVKRFVIQTGTALVIRQIITPDEFEKVVSIEEHTPEGIFITKIR